MTSFALFRPMVGPGDFVAKILQKSQNHLLFLESPTLFHRTSLQSLAEPVIPLLQQLITLEKHSHFSLSQQIHQHQLVQQINHYFSACSTTERQELKDYHALFQMLLTFQGQETSPDKEEGMVQMEQWLRALETEDFPQGVSPEKPSTPAQNGVTRPWTLGEKTQEKHQDSPQLLREKSQFFRLYHRLPQEEKEQLLQQLSLSPQALLSQQKASKDQWQTFLTQVAEVLDQPEVLSQEVPPSGVQASPEIQAPPSLQLATPDSPVSQEGLQEGLQEVQMTQQTSTTQEREQVRKIQEGQTAQQIPSDPERAQVQDSSGPENLQKIQKTQNMEEIQEIQQMTEVHQAPESQTHQDPANGEESLQTSEGPILSRALEEVCQWISFLEEPQWTALREDLERDPSFPSLLFQSPETSQGDGSPAEAVSSLGATSLPQEGRLSPDPLSPDPLSKEQLLRQLGQSPPALASLIAVAAGNSQISQQASQWFSPTLWHSLQEGNSIAPPKLATREDQTSSAPPVSSTTATSSASLASPAPSAPLAVAQELWEWLSFLEESQWTVLAQHISQKTHLSSPLTQLFHPSGQAAAPPSLEGAGKLLLSSQAKDSAQISQEKQGLESLLATQPSQVTTLFSWIHQEPSLRRLAEAWFTPDHWSSLGRSLTLSGQIQDSVSSEASQKISQEGSQEVSQNLSKELLHQVSKDLGKEGQGQEIPPGDAPRELVLQPSAQGNVQGTPQKGSPKMAQEVAQEVATEIGEKIGKEIEKKLAKEMAQGTGTRISPAVSPAVSSGNPGSFKEGPQDLSRQVSGEVSQQMTRQISRPGTRDLSRELSREISKQISRDRAQELWISAGESPSTLLDTLRLFAHSHGDRPNIPGASPSSRTLPPPSSPFQGPAPGQDSPWGISQRFLTQVLKREQVQRTEGLLDPIHQVGQLGPNRSDRLNTLASPQKFQANLPNLPDLVAPVDPINLELSQPPQGLGTARGQGLPSAGILPVPPPSLGFPPSLPPVPGAMPGALSEGASGGEELETLTAEIYLASSSGGQGRRAETSVSRERVQEILGERNREAQAGKDQETQDLKVYQKEANIQVETILTRLEKQEKKIQVLEDSQLLTAADLPEIHRLMEKKVAQTERRRAIRQGYSS